MFALLRSMWQEPRPPGPPERVWRARVWRDWALVGVLVPASVLEGILRPDVPWRVLSLILTVGLVPALLWRRTRPLLMVAIAFGACGLAALLTTGDPPGLNTLVYLVLFPYALFRWGSGREAVAGSAIISGKVVISLMSGEMSPGDTVAAFAILFAAMALGGAFRYRAGARGFLLKDAGPELLAQAVHAAADGEALIAPSITARLLQAFADAAPAPTTAQPIDALTDREVEAIAQERFGSPDVLRLADTDPPEIGPDDVLVQVHAAALDPYDRHMLRGDPLIARLMGGVGLLRPKTPVAEIDAAGLVEAVGANVRAGCGPATSASA